jgi:aryl sulfotransferase
VTAPSIRYRNLVFDSARWEGFAFRDDDIVISTPAKCGTTWTQMICALLIFRTTQFSTSLDLISPWLEMLTRDQAAVVADLEAQTHRRFIKSHTPLDGLPWRDDVTYICVGRDPRDVGLSWDNHMTNLDVAALLDARQEAVGLDDVAEMLSQGPPVRADSQIDRFWAWVDDLTPPEAATSLGSTLHHLSTFWSERRRPNVVLLRYEDLKSDLDGQMRALSSQLGIAVEEDGWVDLVEAATFDEMRRRADQIVPNSTNALWHDNRQFFHRGTSGQWRALLGQDDLLRYKARVAELVPVELDDWVHSSDGL